MSIKVFRSTFTPAPEGWTVGVCVDVIDKGKITGKFGPRDSVQLVFETAHRMDDGKPFTVYQLYGKTLHVRSKLFAHITSWLGSAPSAEQIEAGFEIEILKGRSARLLIQHNESGGDIYANIAAIVPTEQPLAPSGTYQRRDQSDDTSFRPQQYEPAPPMGAVLAAATPPAVATSQQVAAAITAAAPTQPAAAPNIASSTPDPAWLPVTVRTDKLAQPITLETAAGPQQCWTAGMQGSQVLAIGERMRTLKDKLHMPEDNWRQSIFGTFLNKAGLVLDVASIWHLTSEQAQQYVSYLDNWISTGATDELDQAEAKWRGAGVI